MKRIALLIVLVFICIAGCKPGESHIVSTNAIAFIPTRSIPKTGKAGVDISISARGEAYSTCWKNIKVSLDKSVPFKYVLMANGYFESWGACYETEVITDTTITFKPDVAGSYVIFTYTGPNEIAKDTIVVTQ